MTRHTIARIEPSRGYPVVGRSPLPCRTHSGWLPAGLLLPVLLLAGAVLPGIFPRVSLAQYPNVHYFHSSDLPPGTVGRGQLQRGGPLPGYFQPVEVRVPAGVLLSIAQAGQFEPPDQGSITAGMLIGEVYRFRVANIPFFEGLEVYPSVEVINRLYPPPGMERKFPIPVQITLEELQLALNGNFVTRVIYLENPDTALPQAEDPTLQPYYQVRSDEDPLQVADRLGRPMAILRLGSRVPDRDPYSGKFTFGTPPLIKFPPLPEPIRTSPDKVPVERETRDYPRMPLAPQFAPQTAYPGLPRAQTPWSR